MPLRDLIKRILVRFLAVVAIFTLLMVRQTGLPGAYASFHRWTTTPLLSWVLPGIDVRLIPFVPKETVYSAEQMHDSEVVLVNRRAFVRGGNPQGTQAYSSLWMGYVATALFLALMLPTPIPWKRRRRALLVGFLLVQAFVLLRMIMLCIDILSRPTPLALFHPGEAMLDVVTYCSEMATKEPFPSYVIPLIVWALVSFRSGDLNRLRAGGEPEPAGS